MKSKFVVFAFLIVNIYIYFNREEYDQNFINWDASGYYLYLPATIIYHDLNKLEFYPRVNHTYVYNPVDDYGLHTQPNGNKLNKYAIGTSVFQLPFFLTARLYCMYDKTYPDDGYSAPFRRLHAFSTIIWVFIGLLILGAFLRQYFSDGVTALTLMCIGFGTNVYYATVFSPGGSSHPYSFAMFALVLYSSARWCATSKGKYIYWLAIALGLITITRPINIIVGLVPLLWMVGDAASLRERLALLAASKWKIAIGLVLFVMVLFIQLSYWKYITGHWVYYSYEGEYFNFLKPRIWKGLFGWRKGWFIYTPMAFISFLGFTFLWKRDKKMAIAPIAFFIPFTYVVFSWYQWWYGGSFSCRPMTEALPVVAVGLAAFIEYVASQRQAAVKIAFWVAASFCIVLNMFQSYQYALGIINCDSMTYGYYKAVFGKTKVALPELEPLLLKYGQDD